MKTANINNYIKVFDSSEIEYNTKTLKKLQSLQYVMMDLAIYYPISHAK